MLCSNNVSILHSVGVITTCTVLVTACDPEKSFSLDFNLPNLYSAPLGDTIGISPKSLAPEN